MTDTTLTRSSASFRDPDGYVFQYEGEWYRFVSRAYRETYEHLIQSGLYERLIQEHLLIPHQEVEAAHLISESMLPYKILKPSQINVVTYPYEWSFSQLKEAALTTLKIQQIAQTYQMSLKDASSFNIQLFKGKPVLIDTLSFIKQENNQPWLAMGQFYRHFLWPLLVMSQVDVNFNKQFILSLDGFKIDTIKSRFGLKSWFKPASLVHVHLHYLISKLSSNQKSGGSKSIKMNPQGIKIILERLYALIEKLDVQQESIWKDYYQHTNYQDHAFIEKESCVKHFIERHAGKKFIDFGANNGHFSRLALEAADFIYALDFDPMAVDTLYRTLSVESRSKLAPLIMDLTNPSPSVGWCNRERKGILSRLPRDAAGLVLALTHHLHITYNINFNMQAQFFEQYCDELMIEYVDLGDSQVDILLNNRYDTPADYTQLNFERGFGEFYDIVAVFAIQQTKRTLYHLKRK